jgi:hypothetical protein
MAGLATGLNRTRLRKMSNIALKILLVIWIVFLGIAFFYNPSSASSPSVPDRCGLGPVRIIVQEPGPCPDSLKCSMVEVAPGKYERSCVQTLALCYNEHTETWTDWPECGGIRMDRWEWSY